MAYADLVSGNARSLTPICGMDLQDQSDLDDLAAYLCGSIVRNACRVKWISLRAFNCVEMTSLCYAASHKTCMLESMSINRDP